MAEKEGKAEVVNPSLDQFPIEELQMVMNNDSLASILTVRVRKLPEGVWLAFSDEMPGLIVETDSRDEAIDLSRDMAAELIELEGLQKTFQNKDVAFIFE